MITNIKRLSTRLPEFVGVKPFDDTSKFSFLTRMDINDHQGFADEHDESVYTELITVADRALARQRSGLYTLAMAEMEATTADGAVNRFFRAEIFDLETDKEMNRLEQSEAGARMNSGVRFVLDKGNGTVLPISAGVNLILGGTGSGKSEAVKALALELIAKGKRVKPVLMNEPAGKTSLSSGLQSILWEEWDVIVIDSITALDYSLPSAPARKEGTNPNISLMLQYLNNVALLKNVVIIATFNIENVTSIQSVLAAQAMSCITLNKGSIAWSDSRWLTQVAPWGVRDTRQAIPKDILDKAEKLTGVMAKVQKALPELLDLSEGAMMVTTFPEDKMEVQRKILGERKSSAERIQIPRSNNFIEQL